MSAAATPSLAPCNTPSTVKKPSSLPPVDLQLLSRACTATSFVAAFLHCFLVGHQYFIHLQYLSILFAEVFSLLPQQLPSNRSDTHTPISRKRRPLLTSTEDSLDHYHRIAGHVLLWITMRATFAYGLYLMGLSYFYLMRPKHMPQERVVLPAMETMVGLTLFFSSLFALSLKGLVIAVLYFILGPVYEARLHLATFDASPWLGQYVSPVVRFFYRDQ